MKRGWRRRDRVDLFEGRDAELQGTLDGLASHPQLVEGLTFGRGVDARVGAARSTAFGVANSTRPTPSIKIMPSPTRGKPGPATASSRNGNVASATMSQSRSKTERYCLLVERGRPAQRPLQAHHAPRSTSPWNRTGTHHTGTTSSTLSSSSSPTTRVPPSKACRTRGQSARGVRRAHEVVVDQRRAVVRAHLAQHHEACSPRRRPLRPLPSTTCQRRRGPRAATTTP